jgi:parvulin-like peptidyl-prolyl isomerase
MNCRTFYRCLLLLAVLPTFAPKSSGQESAKGSSSDGVVGRAGKEYITEQEFIDRFELTPGLYRHKSSRLDEEKLVTMYSLIAEKLLAQEAEDRGLDLDTAVAGAIRHTAELLARDALYRQEIAGKVVIPASEVTSASAEAIYTLVLKYMYFPEEQDAHFVRAHLDSGKLTDVSVDSSIHFERDTVTVTWGQAEWPIEQAAFALRPGETSPVVKTSKGYYLLQLVRRNRNSPYATMTNAVRRERVHDQLRLRKEEVRLHEFMRSFLRDKKAYAVSRRLKSLAIALSKWMVPQENDSTFSVNKETVLKVKDELAGALDDTMIVAGDRSWTIAEFIDRLFSTGFTVDSKNPLEIANALNSKCLVWTEQSLLADEAIRRGLDRAPEVLRQLQEWRSSFLARAMRQRVEDSVSVSESAVYRFMEQHGSTITIPQIQIRELKTTSVTDIQRAVQDLRTGVSFEQVVRRYNTDSSTRDRGGLTGFFSITSRPPIGDIAGSMSVGQIFGPLRSHDGFLMFQLVARRNSASGDTSFVRRRQDAAEELLRLTRKSHVEQFIAHAAAQRGFSVFADRLHDLHVTPIPMLAYRVLGFGGRMFAVPLLPRLYDWVDVDATKPEIVP